MCNPAAAAPGVFNYTSKINNSTYMLNTNPMAFEGAEGFCNDYGGHLVSYGSKTEQQEVRHPTATTARRVLQAVCCLAIAAQP
jgi:hypothetical protein